VTVRNGLALFTRGSGVKFSLGRLALSGSTNDEHFLEWLSHSDVSMGISTPRR
jgi:hypothetical protein